MLIRETQDVLAREEEDRKRAEVERQRIAATSPPPAPAPAASPAPAPAASTQVAAAPAARAMTIPPVAAPSQGANRFDGNWTVVIRCGEEGGARGYTIGLAGRVSNNVMTLSKGINGQPEWLTIQGSILPDGTAMLQASGLTGPTVYNTGAVPPGTPYGYTVRARFESAQGTGERLGTRPCSLAFSRQ